MMKNQVNSINYVLKGSKEVNYQAVCTKKPKNSEIRKSNMMLSSTQPKVEFPCAFLGFPESARKQDFHLNGKKKKKTNFKENQTYQN